MTSFRSLTGWCDSLAHAEIPIFAGTAASIEELRVVEEVVDAQMLAEAIGNDPLMTLQLFRHVSRIRPLSRTGDAETDVAALLLLGIGPFFRDFGTQTTVDRLLEENEEAREGFFDVSRRATRAARFALAFAVHRMDRDAAIIHEAALLHEFVEMLLWVREPSAMVEIKRRQTVDRQLRSAHAQTDVLGVSIAEIQQKLMIRWGLPELLVQVCSGHCAMHAGVRNVELAARLARHSAHGWTDSAISDDVHDTAQLLNLSQAAALKLLLALDQEQT